MTTDSTPSPAAARVPLNERIANVRAELGARPGWGRLHTYARLTLLEKQTGAVEWIACVYASRTGEQGRAHQCVTGVGATVAAAVADLEERTRAVLSAPSKENER